MALTGGISSKIRLLCKIEFHRGFQHVCNVNTTYLHKQQQCVNNRLVLRHQCRRFATGPASHPQHEKESLSQVCKKEKIAHRTSTASSSSSSSSSDTDFDEQGRLKAGRCLLLSENCKLLARQQLQLLEMQEQDERAQTERLRPPCERQCVQQLLNQSTQNNNNHHINTHNNSNNNNYRSDIDNLYRVSTSSQDVTVEYCRGLPVITVPLPSRREKCKFTLKPITNNVGDLISMLKNEDKGIDRVVAVGMDNTRIAASNTIENLLEEDFKLIVNDHCYIVLTPKQSRITGEEAQRLSDIKTLISQLYEALNVQDYTIQTEKSLTTELETLRQELLPLEEQKIHLDMVAQRKSEWISWFGLGYMSIQFGILARLTWWEYSWDIMEPITYFVTYGSAMVGYAYFLVTKQEYVFQDFKDRQQLLTLHKKAKKSGLDLIKYNSLKDQISLLERDLYKLQHPMKIHKSKDKLIESTAAAATTTTTTSTAAATGN